MLARVGQSGGGLRWDAQAVCWRWADPQGCHLHALAGGLPPAAGQGGAARLLESAAVLAPCASGKLLLALGKRLGALDAPEPALAPGQAQGHGPSRPLQPQVLATIDAAEPRTVISDGRTDRHGHFVFGTANTAPDRRPIGSFYQYSQRHGVRRLALPAVVAAGSICFSVDGSRLYVSDPQRGAILQCRYDADSARCSDLRRFATAVDADGVVHAAVVDRDGCVWSAQGGSASTHHLLRYGPDGALRGHIALDIAEATAGLAFGGAALDQLLLLGARGGLYLLALPESPGMADTPFDDRLTLG